MTLKEITEWVQEIREAARGKLYYSDSEAAHLLEDKLYHDFLKFVAREHQGGLGTMAKKILMTKRIKFLRWYA